MSVVEQADEDKWEKTRVQRVLDYHNAKHGMDIAIRGRTTDIYPELEGHVNWDWVCYETETGDEIAVEVKRITTKELEAKAQVVYDLLHEVRKNLVNRLLGVFVLFVSVPADYNYPFRGQPENRETLRDVITEVIEEWAPRMDVGNTLDLTSEINKGLPFELPITVFLDLHKLDEEGHLLVIERLVGDNVSVGFEGSELESFEQMVSHANYQLGQSKAKETFLVLIEEGLRPADPDEIVDAFKSMNCASYSEISHVYFIRGGKVAEIPLSPKA